MAYCTECGIELDEDSIFCSICGTKTYLDGFKRLLPDAIDEREIITYYFKQDLLKYDQIIITLRIYHGIEMSVRTLKRRLKSYGLSRQFSNISIPALSAILLREMEGPGQSKGYRSMRDHLKRSYGIRVKTDHVMRLMRELDPQGVLIRRNRRLNRRAYSSPGANHCWHVDGYDKLKPYGLAIHGCIDGFSRKIMWLNVVESNNNPVIIAAKYLEIVQEFKFCPTIMRTDLGTENGIMADVHCFFVQNENAHFYGTSVANQRIENWWSFLKRSFTGWIINFFKELVNEGLLILGHHVHMKCVWFVFSNFLQNQLDEVKHEWNSHYIRKSRHDTVSGIPNVLFHVPESVGFEDRKKIITNDMLTNLLDERDILHEAAIAVDENHDVELDEYFRYVVEAEHISFPPKNWTEARATFLQIVNKCV